MKGNKKMRVAGLLAIGLLLVACLIGFFYRPGTSPATSQTDRSAFRKDAYVSINHQIYTQKEYTDFRRMQNFIRKENKLPKLTKKEMDERFVAHQIPLLLAKKVHLQISRKEAVHYTAKMHQAYDRSASKQEKNLLNHSLHWLGLSEEAYWHTAAVNGYREALTLSKLKRAYYAQKLPGQGKEDLIPWSQYQKSLIKKARV
ncbi:MAG: hypothetical protein ABF651_05875 [Sporolactobacillus sp.]